MQCACAHFLVCVFVVVFWDFSRPQRAARLGVNLSCVEKQMDMKTCYQTITLMSRGCCVLDPKVNLGN